MQEHTTIIHVNISANAQNNSFQKHLRVFLWETLGAAAFQGKMCNAGAGQEQVTLIKCFIAVAGAVHALSSPVGPNQCNQNNTAHVLVLFLAHICPSPHTHTHSHNPVVTQCWPAACHWRRPQDGQTVAPDKTSISLSRSYVHGRNEFHLNAR